MCWSVRPAARPVPSMVDLQPSLLRAPREATPGSVAIEDRPLERRRDRTTPTPDVERLGVCFGAEANAAVAREPLQRRRGEARASFDLGAAGLALGQHREVGVHDDLRARCHRAVRLGVRARDVLQAVEALGRTLGVGFVDELGQLLRRSVRGTQDRRHGIGGTANGQGRGAVVVGRQPDAAPPQLRLRAVGIEVPLHGAEAGDDPVEVRGGAVHGDLHQRTLALRRGHPSDRAHLRVRQLPGRERRGRDRQIFERPGHAHVIPCGPHAHADLPAQPARARHALPALMTAAAIELGQQQQEPTGCRGDVRRERGDLRFQPIGRLRPEVVDRRHLDDGHAHSLLTELVFASYRRGGTTTWVRPVPRNRVHRLDARMKACPTTTSSTESPTPIRPRSRPAPWSSPRARARSIRTARSSRPGTTARRRPGLSATS